MITPCVNCGHHILIMDYDHPLVEFECPDCHTLQPVPVKRFTEPTEADRQRLKRLIYDDDYEEEGGNWYCTDPYILEDMIWQDGMSCGHGRRGRLSSVHQQKSEFLKSSHHPILSFMAYKRKTNRPTRSKNGRRWNGKQLSGSVIDTGTLLRPPAGNHGAFSGAAGA